MSIPQLHKVAESLKLKDYKKLNKQELIYKILDERIFTKSKGVFPKSKSKSKSKTAVHSRKQAKNLNKFWKEKLENCKCAYHDETKF